MLKTLKNIEKVIHKYIVCKFNEQPNIVNNTVLI